MMSEQVDTKSNQKKNELKYLGCARECTTISIANKPIQTKTRKKKVLSVDLSVKARRISSPRSAQKVTRVMKAVAHLFSTTSDKFFYKNVRLKMLRLTLVLLHFFCLTDR